jgi:glycine cleavage system regulatory protein
VTNLVLTVIGDDRPGLVSALSAVVATHGGNWLTSELVCLAGKFAGVVLVETPDAQMAGLTGALAELATSQGLQVTATAAGHTDPADMAEPARGIPEPGSRKRCTLALVGNDRPGIVRELSAILAGLGVGIEELHTGTREAPMAGGQLFEARAQLALPEHLSLVQVSSALEATAAELMVDVELADD